MMFSPCSVTRLQNLYNYIVYYMYMYNMQFVSHDEDMQMPLK